MNCGSDALEYDENHLLPSLSKIFLSFSFVQTEVFIEDLHDDRDVCCIHRVRYLYLNGGCSLPRILLSQSMVSNSVIL